MNHLILFGLSILLTKCAHGYPGYPRKSCYDDPMCQLQKCKEKTILGASVYKSNYYCGCNNDYDCDYNQHCDQAENKCVKGSNKIHHSEETAVYDRCACINPLEGESDYREGDPGRTCQGEVISGLQFCYVDQQADCRDKRPALGADRYYSTLACSFGLVPRSGW